MVNSLVKARHSSLGGIVPAYAIEHDLSCHASLPEQLLGVSHLGKTKSLQFSHGIVEETAGPGSLASGASSRRQAQAAAATSRKPFKWTARVG